MGIGKLIGETVDGAMMFGGTVTLAGLLGIGGCSYMVHKYNRDINSIGYVQTYNEAKSLADEDKSGMLSLEETGELYRRAGRVLTISPERDTEIKKLSQGELELAIASYR